MQNVPIGAAGTFCDYLYELGIVIVIMVCWRVFTLSLRHGLEESLVACDYIANKFGGLLSKSG